MQITNRYRTTFAVAGLAALLGGGLLLNRANAKGEATGRVTPWAAMKIANATLKGKPLTATYASEGNKWLYDVLVTKNGKLYEVEVDAVTGKAAPAETVTVAEEAKEMTDDLNKAMGVTTPAAKAGAATEKSEAGEKPEADEKDEKPEKP